MKGLTKKTGILSVCSYSEFKPISYGNGLGYEADIIKKIANKLNLKVEFYPEAIYEQIWAMPEKMYTICDVTIAGCSRTKEREQQGALFSKTDDQFSQSLLIRRQDEMKYKSYSDFKACKIGVVPGTTGKMYAIQRVKEANLDPHDVIVDYCSETKLLTALKKKQIDAIARGEVGNEYQETINPEFKTILRRNFGEGFSIVVGQNNQQLAEMINREIEKLKKSGELDFDKWLVNHFSKRNIKYEKK